jgi:hypothetical protein
MRFSAARYSLRQQLLVHRPRHVGQMSGHISLWPKMRRWFVQSNALARSLQDLSSAGFITNTVGPSCRRLAKPARMGFSVRKGNNLTIPGDLTRRFLFCQLDPGVERPELRQLDFLAPATRSYATARNWCTPH